MSFVSSSVDSLMKNNVDNPYSVSASLGEDGFGASTVNGSMNSHLFTDEPNDALGKMDFLMLLTTQLQYQDPLEPMENTEFVSQLAQFSALEGNGNIEEAITGLSDSFQESLDIQNYNALSSTNAAAVSLVGKEVRLQQNQFFYGVGETASINVHLGDSNEGELQIIDDNGDVIKTLEVTGKDSENSVVVKWDGLTDTGEFASSNSYSLNVVGSEADSSLYCFVEDYVEGIRYTPDGPLVKVGGQELPIGNILDISAGNKGNTSVDSGLSTETAVSLIGKSVKYSQGALTYRPNSGFVEVKAELAGFDNAVVNVKDADGKVVHTALIEKSKGGVLELDCIDHNNNGPYSIELANDNQGYIYSEGVVDGISTQNGITKLKVNGLEISLSEVLDITTV